MLTVAEKGQQPATFGAKLRAAREEKGLTQEALADAAGIHRVDVSRYERGFVLDPAFSVVCRLADALGIDVSKLRDG